MSYLVHSIRSVISNEVKVVVFQKGIRSTEASHKLSIQLQHTASLPKVCYYG